LIFADISLLFSVSIPVITRRFSDLCQFFAMFF